MQAISIPTALVYYLIPRGTGLRNPSHLMHRLGVRSDGSVWLVPETNLPRIPVQAWRDKGATVEVVRFDHERDGETILRLAREAMIRNVSAVREALDKSVAEVERRFKAVPAGDKAALDKAHAYAYSKVQRAKNYLTAAKEAAMAFTILGEVDGLLDGLRDTIKARDTLYYAMYREQFDHKVALKQDIPGIVAVA